VAHIGLAVPSRAIAEIDRASGVIASAPWRVEALTILACFQLAVPVQDGTRRVADFSALATRRDRGSHNALRDATYFAQARIELGVVTCPNGADLDPAWTYDELRMADTSSVPIRLRIHTRRAASRPRSMLPQPGALREIVARNPVEIEGELVKERLAASTLYFR